MHIRKHAAALAATLLTAGTLLATAAPAHADPTDCRMFKENVTATGGTVYYICTGGTGGYAFEYRVKSSPNPDHGGWSYGRTACVPVGQFLVFEYVLNQREVTAIVNC
ncbi:hypothetical protein [Streptosporangium sp. NPDC049376]|uniref:hypothetical protein n=1 Tax=Streptosporangium sp. NPDC049376 TaxID=3366192 RepID=UPI0037A59AEC